MSAALTPPLFTLFSRLVEETCGIFYGASDRDIFAGKLTAHAADRGYDSLLDYYYRLRYDDPGGAELAMLIEALTVHETYFFRELPPLVQLVDGHLAEVVRTRGRARVWSAACSSGEEPLTMAMLLDDRGLLDRVEIIGSDISAPVIARAASGRYRKRSARDGHPTELAARYLEVGPDGVTIAPRILGAVSFRTLNLCDADAVRGLGHFDVILCRNVLIYFSDERVSAIIDLLGESLVSDGLLAVGFSESLLRFGTSLVCEERGSSFFYRRAR
jgi:chemotaxis protein methyltransferase CheR